jgi:hypothetical protein
MHALKVQANLTLTCVLFVGQFIHAQELPYANGRDLMKAVIMDGKRFDGIVTELEITNVMETGDPTISRERFCFLDSDQNDTGALRYGVSILMPNPGEPHINDPWISKEFSTWNGKQKTYFKRVLVGIKGSPRYSDLEVAGYQQGVTKESELSAYFVGDGRRSKQWRLGSYAKEILDTFELDIIGEEKVLGVDCTILEFYSKELPKPEQGGILYFITNQKPHLIMKLTSRTEDRRILYEVTELSSWQRNLEIRKGYETAFTGIQARIPGLLRRQFEVVDRHKADTAGRDKWLVEIPTGSIVRNFENTNNLRIPFSAEEQNAIRSSSAGRMAIGIFDSTWRIWLNLGLVILVAVSGYKVWRRSHD